MHGMEIVKLQSISFIIALTTAGVTGWPADACLLYDKAVLLEVMTKKKRCSSTIWYLIFIYFVILKLFICVL
jgi:hypothetical protein